MPVKVEQDQGNYDIYRFDFTGRWTWDELFEAINQAIAMGDSKIRNDMIINLEDPRYLATGAIEKVKNITRTTPSNGGLYIMVGLSALPAAFIQVFRRLYQEGNSWRTARTVDEARAMIQQHRADTHYKAV